MDFNQHFCMDFAQNENFDIFYSNFPFCLRISIFLCFAEKVWNLLKIVNFFEFHRIIIWKDFVYITFARFAQFFCYSLLKKNKRKRSMIYFSIFFIDFGPKFSFSWILNILPKYFWIFFIKVAFLTFSGTKSPILWILFD